MGEIKVIYLKMDHPQSSLLEFTGSGCNEHDLLAFEDFIHSNLPADYRRFLKEFNGGIPSAEKDTFIAPIDLPGGNSITVSQFYTLCANAKPLLSLYHQLEKCVGFLSMTTIAIGHDNFGNIIGLDCEDGTVNWTVCEGRFHLDLYRNFEFKVSFSEFFGRLIASPYQK